MSSTVLVLGNDGENVEWNEWVEEVDSKVFELGGEYKYVKNLKNIIRKESTENVL